MFVVVFFNSFLLVRGVERKVDDVIGDVEMRRLMTFVKYGLLASSFPIMFLLNNRDCN